MSLPDRVTLLSASAATWHAHKGRRWAHHQRNNPENLSISGNTDGPTNHSVLQGQHMTGNKVERMHASGSLRTSASVTRTVLWVLAGLALAYLIIAHPAHLLGWLPFLAILACPLMHLFMHRDHHGRPKQPKSEQENVK